MFDLPFIKFGFLIINSLIRGIDNFILSLPRFSIGIAAGINLLRSYLHGYLLEFLLKNLFGALGMTKGSLNGLFLVAIILALSLFGLYKIYIIFFPESRPWINLENLIRNTLFSVVLVLSGFTLLQQIEEARILLSESVAESLRESVSNFPKNDPNFDFPAICYSGHGTPCEPELDCAKGIGCINKSVADKVGGLIGIKDPKEIFVTDLPPDFQAAYNLNDSNFSTSFKSLLTITYKWVESITLAVIGAFFSIPILLESLSVLMLDLTALVLFLTLPLAIIFSFFSITEGFFTQLIQKYINVLVLSLVLFTVIPTFVEISFRVGGYIALGLTSSLLWGATLFMVYQPLMDSMTFAIDGSFRAAGLGGFSESIQGALGAAGSALSFGVGLATGGAGMLTRQVLGAGVGAMTKVAKTAGAFGLGAVAGAGMMRQANPLSNNNSSSFGIVPEKSISGEISKPGLVKSNQANAFASDKNKDNQDIALNAGRGSVSDSIASGIAAVQTNGAQGLLSKDKQFGGDKNKNLSSKTYGQSTNNTTKESVEYERLKNMAASGDKDAKIRLNQMIKTRAKNIESGDVASDKYLQPIRRGTAEIKSQASKISTQNILSNKMANNTELVNDGEIRFIDSSKIAENVQNVGTSSFENTSKSSDNIVSAIGDNGKQAVMTLSKQVIPDIEVNGNSITAFDVVQNSYQDALVDLQKSAPGGNILPLLRDNKTGELNDNAPLMNSFVQALNKRGAGKIMTNASLKNSAVEYLSAVTKVQAQLPGIEMVSAVRNAAEQGISPSTNLQTKYKISAHEFNGGLGTIVSHIAQNPDTEMSPIINAIAANPRKEALQSFTEKIQDYIRTEIAKGDSCDKNVQILFNKSKPNIQHIQASQMIVKNMAENGLIDKEEWSSFKTTYETAAQNMGIESGNSTIFWKTIEALRTIPAYVPVMVEPSSPLAAKGSYVVKKQSVNEVSPTQKESQIAVSSIKAKESVRTALINSLLADFEMLNDLVEKKQNEYINLFGENPPQINISLSKPITQEKLEKINDSYRKYLNDLETKILSKKSEIQNNVEILDLDDGFFIE